MDGRRQPALMIMPHELPDPGDDVVNRVKRRRPVDLRFEPLPEPFDGIVLGRIGGQVFEPHPVGLGEEPFDGTALMNRGIIEDQDEQGLRKPLMELVQELQKGDFEQVYVRGTEEYILVMGAGPNAVLTVSATRDVKLGLIFLDTKRACEKIARLV